MDLRGTTIENRYGLPPALLTIRNGRLEPIYPLELECRGDNGYTFAAKYIGEINHIYELLNKVISHQVIDELHPLPNEFKVENNKLYIRDGSTNEWKLIGDVTKPYFGANEETLEQLEGYVKDVDYDGGTITISKGNGELKRFQIQQETLKLLNSFIKEIAYENGTITIAKGDGTTTTYPISEDILKAVSGYTKDVTTKDGRIVVTKADGTVKSYPMGIDSSYLKKIEYENGVLTVKQGNGKAFTFNIGTEMIGAISNETIDAILG